MSFKANCLACLANTGFCILNPMLSLYVKFKVRTRKLYRKLQQSYYNYVRLNTDDNLLKKDDEEKGYDSETDDDYNEYSHEEDNYEEDFKCDKQNEINNVNSFDADDKIDNDNNIDKRNSQIKTNNN